MQNLLELQHADIMAKDPLVQEKKQTVLRETEKLYQEVQKRGDCVSLKQLAVNGKDFIELGVSPGREIGEILCKLLQEVLDEPEKNKKEYLLPRGKEFLK